MVAYLKEAMGEILDEVDWFDEPTRAAAKLKVNQSLAIRGNSK